MCSRNSSSHLRGWPMRASVVAVDSRSVKPNVPSPLRSGASSVGAVEHPPPPPTAAHITAMTSTILRMVMRPTRTDRPRDLQRPLERLADVPFEHVANLDVVVTLQLDAALQAGLHFLHVVLHAAERVDLQVFRDDLSV